MEKNNHSQHIYDLCKEHMHAYVLAETKDGYKFDGIITGLDEEHVYFAVPKGEHHGQHMQDYMQKSMMPGQRQYKPGLGYGGGYGSYGGYGGYGGYGPGYYNYPPRRFERLIVPLAALTALTLLPWY